MSGFLERWATQDGSSEAEASTADQLCTKDEAITSPTATSPGPVGRTVPSSFESARKGTADPDQRRMTSSAPPRDDEDSYRSDGFNKVAALLAIACRRSQELQRMQMNRLQNPVDSELANSANSSVHGVVQ